MLNRFGGVPNRRVGFAKPGVALMPRIRLVVMIRVVAFQITYSFTNKSSKRKGSYQVSNVPELKTLIGEASDTLTHALESCPEEWADRNHIKSVLTLARHFIETDFQGFCACKRNSSAAEHTLALNKDLEDSSRTLCWSTLHSSRRLLTAIEEALTYSYQIDWDHESSISPESYFHTSSEAARIAKEVAEDVVAVQQSSD